MTKLKEIRKYIEEVSGKTIDIAKKVWDYAELSYNEFNSCKVLTEALISEGFEVVENIAGMPTAFTATFKKGNGKPVMGFLAEYDALDGLSQKAGCTTKEPVVESGSGHGCGHNLLGAGSFASAVAVKKYLENNNLDGTVVLFGCPAEEGAGSKQFIARAGYFDDVDYVYTWHPGTFNEVQSTGSVAIMGANFIFDGIASHAGGAPHLGRSALDACELMNVGCNYLREHMLDQARIHYAYSNAGGTAPNVVPDHATIKYEVRAPKVSQMQELFTRVVDVAKGAALMTGTKMRYEITMAFSDYVPNKALSEVMSEALQEAGAPEWTEEEYALAKKFLSSYSKETLHSVKEELSTVFEDEDELNKAIDKPLCSVTVPFDPKAFKYESGSTDVGDVGYATPTTQLSIATACLGCIAHSWQWTAFSGSDIGMKGMLKAAEIMALATVNTMDKPEIIEAAKKELKIKNGGKYNCPLPETVNPPIGKY